MLLVVRRGREKLEALLPMEFPEDALALHAATLTLTHPTTLEPVKAVAPLPPLFTRLLGHLKQRTLNHNVEKLVSQEQ